MAFGDDALDVLGSAGSGALSGLAAGGPIGAAIGGLIGGLSSLLGPKKKKRTFNDPYAGQRQALASQLASSDIGQRQGQLVARQAGNMARTQMEQAQNNPAYAGNASVLSALNENLQNSANEATSSAFLRGSQIDDENKARAASILGDSSRLALASDQYADELDSRKSFGESMLQNVLSTGAGYGLSSLLGGGATPSNGQPLTLGNDTIDRTPQSNASGLLPGGYSPSLLSGAANYSSDVDASPAGLSALNGGGYEGGLPSPEITNPMNPSDDWDYVRRFGRKYNAFNPPTTDLPWLSPVRY